MLRASPAKSKAKKSLEDVTAESFGAFAGINETLRKEIKSLQGQKNRAYQKIQELQGTGDDYGEEPEEKLDPVAIKQAVKSIMPNASDFQIEAALNIPQVKQLLGNGENLKLITELLPLLKAGNNSNQSDPTQTGSTTPTTYA
jgi:hypothetical protein